jgi:Ca2+-binding EF-hand superfamily protein
MNRSEKLYVEAFKIIDDNEDGVLDREELKRANLITGAGLSDDDIDAIMKYVELKFNGKFTFNQILKMLFRKPFDYHLN